MGDKAALRRKLMERRSALVIMLDKLRNDPATMDQEKYRAVDQALGVIDTHLNGEWDKVDQTAAAELSRWLETTSDIVVH